MPTRPISQRNLAADRPNARKSTGLRTLIRTPRVSAGSPPPPGPPPRLRRPRTQPDPGNPTTMLRTTAKTPLGLAHAQKAKLPNEPVYGEGAVKPPVRRICERSSRTPPFAVGIGRSAHLSRGLRGWWCLLPHTLRARGGGRSENRKDPPGNIERGPTQRDALNHLFGIASVRGIQSIKREDVMRTEERELLSRTLPPGARMRSRSPRTTPHSSTAVSGVCVPHSETRGPAGLLQVSLSSS